jgi:hypothetical protein
MYFWTNICEKKKKIKQEMWMLLIVRLEMTVYRGTFQPFILKKCLNGTGVPQGATTASNISLCFLWMYQFHSLFSCRENIEFCINEYFK